MKKFLSYLRWFGNMMLPLLGFITAPIIFPLLYPFRNQKWTQVKPFWYYFDDEDGVYGAEYWRVGNNLEKNFITAYRWSALRNPAWNLQASITPKQGPEVYVESKGKLINEGVEVPNYYIARLNYVDSEGKWTNNVGQYLSLKFSFIGKTKTWFTKGGTLYWRYTVAKKLWGTRWIEIQMGTTERHVFKIKSINKVKIYEEQSI